jgi:hypothetical protein
MASLETRAAQLDKRLSRLELGYTPLTKEEAAAVEAAPDAVLGDLLLSLNTRLQRVIDQSVEDRIVPLPVADLTDQEAALDRMDKIVRGFENGYGAIAA